MSDARHRETAREARLWWQAQGGPTLRRDLTAQQADELDAAIAAALAHAEADALERARCSGGDSYGVCDHVSEYVNEIGPMLAALRAVLAPILVLAEKATLKPTLYSVGACIDHGGIHPNGDRIVSAGVDDDAYADLTADDCALIVALVNALPALRALASEPLARPTGRASASPQADAHSATQEGENAQ